MQATVTVTVMDGATVFEGTETAFRYDLTGAAIAEGSALEGVVEQIKELAAGAWPECTVGLVADPSGTDITRKALVLLMRHLRVEGATVLSTGQLEGYQPPGPDTHPLTDEFLPIDEQSPPEGDAIDARKQFNNGNEAPPAVRIVDKETKDRRFEPFHALIGVVVITLIGVSLWAAGVFSRGADDSERVSAQDEETPQAVAEMPGPPPSPTQSPQSRATSTEADTGAWVEAGGLRAKLPRGFKAGEEDGVVTATGQDPDLRVLLAADPLYSVPAEALFAELRDEIAMDPTLELPENGGADEDGQLTYVENPGDKSQVTWTTWVHEGHQMSVGCHSRQTPTRAHRAACRMAVESMEKVI